MTNFKVSGDDLLGAKKVPWLPFRDVTIKPKYIVVHYTGGSSVASSINYLRKVGFSYHLLIDRDGAVVQGAPLAKRASHAGYSNWKGLDSLNNHSIGISLANLGYLDRHGTKFYRTNSHGDKTTNTFDDSEVVASRHWNGHNGSTVVGWERYTEKQYESLKLVCSALIDAFPNIVDAIGHDEIAIGRKPDPGVAFEWANISSLFSNRLTDLGPVYEVNVGGNDKLNVRKGPNGTWGVSDKLAPGTRVHLRSFAYTYWNGKPRKSNWASIALDGSMSHYGFVSSKYLTKI